MNIWREAPEKTKNRSRDDYRDIRIEDLDLSVRSYNSLKRGGCHTVGDILNAMGEDENGLRRIRNLGARSEAEIKEKLEEAGRGHVRITADNEPEEGNISGTETENDRVRIVLRLPRKIWDKEIGEFNLSHYAEDRLKGCGISRVRDLYATHPKNEPGWYAVRELFRKIAENEKMMEKELCQEKWR